MIKKIKLAYKNKELIALELKNNLLDDYLVGFVKKYDERGLILCNVDYRGIQNAYIYLGYEEIISVLEKPAYLEKIRVLMDGRIDEKYFLKISDKMNLKNAFLDWSKNMEKYGKKLNIIMGSHVIYGCICSISEKSIDIEKVDEITDVSNGHTVLLLSHMNYIGLNIQNEEENS